MNNQQIRHWRHTRKGDIRGIIVGGSDDGVWVDIELAGDHQLRYLSTNRGPEPDRSVIRVRASFLTEIDDA